MLIFLAECIFRKVRSNKMELVQLVKDVPKVIHMAIEEMGYSATDVARHLEIKQTSVLQSVKKGKILCGGLGLQA